MPRARPSRGRWHASFFHPPTPASKIGYEPTLRVNFSHECREGPRRRQGTRTRGGQLDTVVMKPNGQRIAFDDPRRGALAWQQPDVDCVSIEGASKAFGDEHANAGGQNHRDRDLHRRAAAEVSA